MTSRAAGLPFILITMLIDILGIGLIIPVLPDIVADVTRGTGYDPSAMFGILLGVYALMQFGFSPIIGAMSDRFGRRPVLLVSLAGLCVDFLLTYFATSLEWLFVARVVSGITAANITTANAYIADVSTPEDRVKNFGAAGAMLGIGFIIGPAVGGLIGAVNPRLPFLFAAVLAGLNFVYGYFVLPESLPVEKRVAASSGPLGVNPDVLNPFGTVLTLRRYPTVLGLAGVTLLTAMGSRALESTWILYCIERFKWTPLENGLSLGVFGVLMAIVQGVLVAPLSRSLGEGRVLIYGLALGAMTDALYGFATQGWMIFAIMVPSALGGVAMPATQSLVTQQVGESEQGTVQGALTALTSLAAVLMPPLTTWLFGRFSDERGVYLPGVGFFISAGFLALATVAAVRLMHQTRKHASEHHLARIEI